MQTALNDDVLDVVEHPLDAVFVGGASAVAIDVFAGQIAVLRLELPLNETVAFFKARRRSFDP